MLSAVASRLQSVVQALLGISTYQPPPRTYIDQKTVDDIRESLGGQLQLPAASRVRWYLDDLETAEHAANNGDLSLAAQLCSIAQRDGVVSGVLSTRTSGLVELPRRFKGDAEIVKSLEPGDTDVRSVYDELMPPAELALLAADGIMLGVGVAELIPVKGRDYPVLCRLDPQFLRYVWSENQWYYNAAEGRLPVVPGDGRWILHTPGGRLQPWQSSLWRAIGRAYIRKDHASLYKDNWEAKLANPARVAVAPQGSTEAQKDSWFRAIMAWGVNSVFGMTPGYDVKLLESNGRGYESFKSTIADQNEEMIIAIAGQKVTTDGGAGFQNSEIHQMIRSDLIKKTADGLAYTINTQILPSFIVGRYGEDALEDRAVIVAYDITPPEDRNSEAQSMIAVGAALDGLTTALAAAGMKPDVATLCARFGIPVVSTSEPIGTDGSTIEDATADGAEPGTPTLRLVEPLADDQAPTDAGAEQVADTALNGAQITALLDIVGQVTQGLIPRDAAIAIIMRSFTVNKDQAEALLGSAGAGFVPASTEAPAPNPAPEQPQEAAA